MVIQGKPASPFASPAVKNPSPLRVAPFADMGIKDFPDGEHKGGPTALSVSESLNRGTRATTLDLPGPCPSRL